MQLTTIDAFVAGGCGPLAVGDVLAFRGSSKVDEFIQDATASGISHVAVLLRDPGAPGFSLLEATGAGVTVTPVADALASYQKDHTCYYLPLGPGYRPSVDAAKLVAFYTQNAKERYNYGGVVAAGLYDLDNPLLAALVKHLGTDSEIAKWLERYETFADQLWKKVFGLNASYRRLFCSQLVTEALIAAGVAIPGPPNPRLVVPVEVCHFPIFGDAYQLNGAPLVPDAFRWSGAPVAAPTAAAPAQSP